MTRKLTVVVGKRVRVALHYRFDMLAALALSFIQLFALKALWTAAYATGVGDKSIPLPLLLSYIILGNIIAEALTISLWEDFAWRIKDGSIVSDLARPIDFEALIFMHVLGDTTAKIITRLVPKVIVAWIIFRFHVPTDPALWGVFLLSLVLGYFVLFTLNFIISAAAFIFTEAWGIEAVKNLLVLIFSGIYIPLWMYPEWLQPLVNATPFRAYLAVPMSLYIGQTPLEQAAPALLFQLVWAVILFLTGRVVVRAALRRAVLFGG